MKIIPIVLATDDNLVLQTKVTLCSIIDYAMKCEKITATILCNHEMREGNRQILLNIANEKCDVNLISVEQSVFETRPAGARITTPTFYRLLIPELMPKLNKCIYMDVDFICKGSLSPVFDLDISQYYLAAVRDFGCTIHKNKYREYFQRIGIKDAKNYFNAGFLVMNLRKMRDDNIQEKFINQNSSELMFADQDILNIVCQEKVLFLPENYNVFVKYMEIYRGKENNNKKVVNYHFIDFCKPWTNLRFRYADVWWECAKGHLSESEYSMLYNETRNRTYNSDWNTTIEKIESQKSVLFFGYTEITKFLCDILKLRNYAGEVYIIDNNISLQGNSYDSTEISAPDILSNYHNGIIINTVQKRWKEVEQQILSYDICIDNIYNFQMKKEQYYYEIDEKYFMYELWDRMILLSGQTLFTMVLMFLNQI